MSRQLHCRDMWLVEHILNQRTSNFGLILNLIEISLVGWVHGPWKVLPIQRGQLKSSLFLRNVLGECIYFITWQISTCRGERLWNIWNCWSIVLFVGIQFMKYKVNNGSEHFMPGSGGDHGVKFPADHLLSNSASKMVQKSLSRGKVWLQSAPSYLCDQK